MSAYLSILARFTQNRFFTKNSEWLIPFDYTVMIEINPHQKPKKIIMQFVSINPSAKNIDVFAGIEYVYWYRIRLAYMLIGSPVMPCKGIISSFSISKESIKCYVSDFYSNNLKSERYTDNYLFTCQIRQLESLNFYRTVSSDCWIYSFIPFGRSFRVTPSRVAQDTHNKVRNILFCGVGWDNG